jgi:hypothetical protein
MMGPWVCKLLATLCVALSLALFALGRADLVGGFFLRTLSFSRPMTSVRPILATVVVSHAVEGQICKESRRRVRVYNTVYCILQGPIASPPRL